MAYRRCNCERIPTERKNWQTNIQQNKVEKKEEEVDAVVTKRIGSNITFHCRYNQDEATIKLYWLKNTGVTAENNETISARSRYVSRVEGDIYSLTIKDIIESDEAVYKCMSIKQHFVSYRLVVIDPPKITRTFPPHSQPITTLNEGDDIFRMECQAAGNPRPVITWYKKQNSKHDDAITTLATNTSSYTLFNITKDHKGKYVCKASNEFGDVDEFTFTINIAFQPRITQISEDQLIAHGDSFTIVCVVASNPLAVVKWFKVYSDDEDDDDDNDVNDNNNNNNNNNNDSSTITTTNNDDACFQMKEYFDFHTK
ncbi:hypothetical protein HELRODRAFT_181854 [Helobdella robusta]|uniref:Ig-like domain-containing protein n=1 Tax=Helobdella robusta TaxID=6412 RepID=T1FHE5_HELRO|nr:hypothetical protein HELRODRAFT_181854 [Helobdella robusta]ESN92074.1 hypothetical protein HELRODRAFT_181854 [Helobdella robusta]